MSAHVRRESRMGRFRDVAQDLSLRNCYVVTSVEPVSEKAAASKSGLSFLQTSCCARSSCPPAARAQAGYARRP